MYKIEGGHDPLCRPFGSATEHRIGRVVALVKVHRFVDREPSSASYVQASHHRFHCQLRFEYLLFILALPFLLMIGFEGHMLFVV